MPVLDLGHVVSEDRDASRVALLVDLLHQDGGRDVKALQTGLQVGLERIELTGTLRRLWTVVRVLAPVVDRLPTNAELTGNLGLRHSLSK